MRRSRRSGVRKRSTSRRKTTRRSTRRPAARTFRKRQPRRMTRKSILNLTAQKKRDTMAPGNTFPALPENVGSLTVTSDVPALVLWNATARALSDTPTSATTMPTNAQRLSSTPFIVGLKETVTIRTDTSNAWRWRRMVFTLKGIPPGFTDTADITRVFSQVDTGQDTVEYQRVNTPLPFALVADVYNFVFRGLGINNFSVPPRDWLDPITAPVDTTRISMMYDKVTAINSGNDAGVARTYKRWHPVRKNLNYADQEIGGVMTTSPFSTTGKPGCGDVYVLDLFVGNSSDAGDVLDFLPTSTLYWHEK
ncbi:capsid protein [Sewage derived gemycircularvirus 1]|uniref:Capsid protein n=1 Tax=Sewage derived gemycircularvirus 1 TaxID=1985407 RepID=A0A0A7CL69_9VIRU|nr:capsid protein [Sewage derived gemycircularvirus 1]AIF34836.1 capsid protein [Sewage derived gemycircularvirus 1]